MSTTNKFTHRENRFNNRALTGLGKWLALWELNAAARLWQVHAPNSDGLVVDFGAGNGIFWDIATPPKNLLLMDISANLLETSQTPCLKVVSDALHPPLELGSCSGIMALGLIEYIRDLDGLFCRWRELAGDDCMLLISNSPPILPNLARQWLGFGAKARRDDVVRNSLRNSGWELLSDTPVRVGWQSLFVAK